MVSNEDADAARLARVRAILEGAYGEDWLEGLTVLDLGSLTGTFAEGLAADGCIVTAIEGRQANLDQVPQPAGATYVHSDVRMVDFASRFDVVLCLGLLYHLPAGDALTLLEDLAQCTDLLMIIDTHIAGSLADEWVDLGGFPFRGSTYGEGDALAPWSAMHNTESFWFAEQSLILLLAQAGWGRVEAIEGPAYSGEPEDRRWYVVRPRETGD